MTSPDGVTWTIRQSPNDNNWASICYGTGAGGAGVFVAVASGGTGGDRNRAMTSPDGITWTSQTTPAQLAAWVSVVHNNGRFAAVAAGGADQRVMNTLDYGVTWTSQTPTGSVGIRWASITWGLGQYVAVAFNGTAGSTSRVLTSSTGTGSWTLRTAASTNAWRAVAFGNSTFVSVASSGSGDRVMTSTTGTGGWTSQASAADNAWSSVCFGPNLWVAVSADGASRIMTSNDNGVTWVLRQGPPDIE